MEHKLTLIQTVTGLLITNLFQATTKSHSYKFYHQISLWLNLGWRGAEKYTNVQPNVTCIHIAKDFGLSSGIALNMEYVSVNLQAEALPRLQLHIGQVGLAALESNSLKQ
jgi:hypothetical protein